MKKLIQLSGKAVQVFVYWATLLHAYGNMTLKELEEKATGEYYGTLVETGKDNAART
jgi:hypothetical protein